MIESAIYSSIESVSGSRALEQVDNVEELAIHVCEGRHVGVHDHLVHFQYV